jgi:hypothetical protein
MNIVKQSGIPYEILIRFAHPDSVDKAIKLGDLVEAHYIDAEALVDADSGEVIQYKPGEARVLPRDKVEDYLGDRFVAIEAQQRDLQARLEQSIADGKAALDQAGADATAAAEAAAKQLADRDAEIARLTAALQAGAEALAEASARNAAAAAALNG